MSSELPRSPLAPDPLAPLPPVAGVAFFTGHSGTKYQGRDDVFLARFVEGTVGAGSFTRNQVVGAPVTWTRAAAAPRALIVNAGNANVANGTQGQACVEAVAQGLAQAEGIAPKSVWQASTGVIGEPLDPQPIVQTALAAPLSNAEAAAAACLTTDTFVKTASRTVDGVTIAGFAKGSGMVQPNMATMLAFVFTDAKIDTETLKSLHQQAVDRSLNAITVDSDTSTSDMALTFATGQGPAASEGFGAALEAVYRDLAQLVVRDGEGASKFVEIEVAGAGDEAEARALALQVANSPLVKTMIAGEDANWGRLLMALGKGEVAVDPEQISVRIGGIDIARNGARIANYDEAPVAAHMKGQEISIELGVGSGAGRAKVWTCDLTHGYISINADYRS